ncbi:MAG: hypothetical protein ACOX69_12165 [Coriobacteriales bacterium]|jgi:PHD/YefM family antitoxin component YafN of YafNO toxin-antitoxin module
MATCVPIKSLKDTTAFSNLVENSDEEVIVTRNGEASFAAISLDQLDAYKLNSARLELYERIDEAQADIEASRVEDAAESQRKARERYGL